MLASPVGQLKRAGVEFSISEGLNDQQLLVALEEVKDIRILHFNDARSAFKGFAKISTQKAFQVCCSNSPINNTDHALSWAIAPL